MSASRPLGSALQSCGASTRRIRWAFGGCLMWSVAGCKSEPSGAASAVEATALVSTSTMGSPESALAPRTDATSAAVAETVATLVSSASTNPESPSPSTSASSAVATTKSNSAKGPRPPGPTSHGSGEFQPRESARPAAALIASPAVAGEGYRAYLQGSSPLRVGHEAMLTVHLEPQSPFKSNDKYPYRFAVSGSEGVNAPSVPVTTASVTPTRTTLHFPVTATRAGHGTVSGTFSFSVCTPEKCLVERAPLVLSFEVVTDAVSASPHP